MPPLIIGVALLAVGLPLASTYIVGIGLSLVLSGVSSLFNKKAPKTPVFSQEASSRTITVRQPIAPWRVTYGQGGYLGGIITFIGTSGATNQFLNMVITLNGHEIQSIDNVRFDGVIVPLDGSGNATGTFAGFVHVEKNLGTAAQAAFAGLITEMPTQWTSNHRQRGRAGVFVRLKWNADKFPNGVPNITFDIHGHNAVTDVRTSTVGYSFNPALCLYEYLTNTSYGLGIATADIDTASFIAAANVCDENVNLNPSGTEDRYTCNGSFETNQRPAETIKQLLTSMAGYLVYTAGKWSVYAGAWRAPTISLGDNDARDSIKVQSRLSKRETCNGIKGVYVNPTNNWKPSDFPAYYQSSNRGFGSDAYFLEDGSERIWRDVEYPFTISAATAQRLAKIDLERTRRQVSVQYPARLTGYQVVPPDVLQLTHSRFGWTTKTFEVQQAKLEQYEDDQNAPTLGVSLFLRELDSNVFAWTTAEELPANAIPTTPLPDMGIVPALTGLTLTSGGVNAVLGKEGKVLTSIFVVWTASTSEFVISGGAIEVQYKKTADSIWLSLADVPGVSTKAEIKNAEHGVGYDIRIRPRNSAGTVGAYTTGSHTADHGVTAPGTPTIPTTALPIQGGIKFVVTIAGLTTPHIERYNVYRHTSNVSGSATLIGFISNSISDTTFNVTFQDSDIKANQEYFYWVSVVNIAKVEGTLTTAGSTIASFAVAVEPINLLGNPNIQGSGNLPAANGAVTEQWQQSVTGAGGTPEYRNGREIRLPLASGGGSPFSKALQYKPISRFRPNQVVTWALELRRAGLVGSPTGTVSIHILRADTNGTGFATEVGAASINVSDLSATAFKRYRVTGVLNRLGGQGFYVPEIRNNSTQDDVFFTEGILNPGNDASLFTANNSLYQTDVAPFTFEGYSFVSDDFTNTNATLITVHYPTAGGGSAGSGVGAMWSETLESAGTAQVKIQTNKAELVWTSGAKQSILKQRLTADAVAYYTQADCDAKSGSGAQQAGVCARMTDSSNFYLARILNSNVVDLFKRVAGAFTNLGTYTHSGPSGTIKLQVTDATKKVFVAGTERISTGDNALTGAGAPGAYLAVDSGTPTNNPTVDLLSATYVQNVSAPPAPPAAPTPPPPIDYDPVREPPIRRLT